MHIIPKYNSFFTTQHYKNKTTTQQKQYKQNKITTKTKPHVNKTFVCVGVLFLQCCCFVFALFIMCFYRVVTCKTVKLKNDLYCTQKNLNKKDGS
jgi:hypothetical protein